MKYYFVSPKEIRLSNLISENIPFITQSKIKKLLSEKEIKVNGVKTSLDSDLKKGDKVDIFVPAVFLRDYQVNIVYQDNFIIVADKPPLMDVENNLKDYLFSIAGEVFPVHRLDRNTTGLVVMAKAVWVRDQLDQAFKNQNVTKKYRAQVKGIIKENSQTLLLYLFKDAVKNMVYVSQTPKSGYKKALTSYRVLSRTDSDSLVDIELLTGRTHQIRASFAFIGHPIIGDNKYGDANLNKIYGAEFQRLKAYFLQFHNLTGKLEYLNNLQLCSENNI